MTTTSCPAGSAIRPPQSTAAGVVASVLVAGVLASLANVVVALIALSLGVPEGFHPLEPSAYVRLTFVGVLLGALGWLAVRRWASNPDRTLQFLIPSVVVLSFIPDIALPFNNTQPNPTLVGVVALMVMHVVVALIAVPAYRRFLPITR
jgi:hypothetical protein